MDPTQQSQQKQPPQQSASDYYNKYRKRSFFLSRLTVFTSMAVLIVALVVNISLLYSQEKSTATTHADTPTNQTQLLPSLPVGCSYQQMKKGLAVVCPTPTAIPTLTATASAVPINVALPALPPQCTIEASSTGSQLHCTAIVPIPTVAVTLPPTCETGNQTNMLSCTVNSKAVPVPLPSLPGGCSYTLRANQYYVVCEAK